MFCFTLSRDDSNFLFSLSTWIIIDTAVSYSSSSTSAREIEFISAIEDKDEWITKSFLYGIFIFIFRLGKQKLKQRWKFCGLIVLPAFEWLCVFCEKNFQTWKKSQTKIQKENSHQKQKDKKNYYKILFTWIFLVTHNKPLRFSQSTNICVNCFSISFVFFCWGIQKNKYQNKICNYFSFVVLCDYFEPITWRIVFWEVFCILRVLFNLGIDLGMEQLAPYTYEIHLFEKEIKRWKSPAREW